MVPGSSDNVMSKLTHTSNGYKPIPGGFDPCEGDQRPLWLAMYKAFKHGYGFVKAGQSSGIVCRDFMHEIDNCIGKPVCWTLAHVQGNVCHWREEFNDGGLIKRITEGG